jgi:hypothetical protein
MKHLKKVVGLLITVVLLDFQIITGQAVDGGYRSTIERPDMELLSRLRLNRTMTGIEKVNYSNIIGDPFLYKDFIPGSLTLKTGETLPLYLRYDIYTDEIQFRQKEEIYVLVNTESVSVVMMDTLKFIYTRYMKSPGDISSIENSWFLLKEDGKCRLLIKKNLRLQSAEDAKPYQAAKPAKFIKTNDSFYLQPEGQNAMRVTSRKDILSILSDKSSELNKFIDSARLGAKDINDLRKIVAFYNSR